jgi:hypothetical protein
MTRISAIVAATLAAFAAAGHAGEIRFVPGQGTPESLSDADRAIAQLAIDALAADLQIPADEILLDTVRAVDWRNSSLGCPKPGMAYLDVITPGHKVTLRAGSQVYVVHEAKNKAFVCHGNKALGGITPEHQLTFAKPLIEARDDLAKRLGAEPKDIRFLSSEGHTWNDASLDCPEPGQRYAQVKTRGWKLTFGYRDRTYTYHTDLTRTIPCPPIAAD